VYLLLDKDKLNMDSNMDSNISKHYLTEYIFLENDKLYYEENDKIKDIKKHNWHHLLNEYGWEKLNKHWIKKLNGFLEKPNNNSLYGSLDCGGDGDCLFHCISYAISMVNNDINYDSKTLRKNISDSLTQERYDQLIEIYKIMNNADDFDESWKPEEMNINKFKTILIEGGNEYWGDFLILSLIKEYLDINIIILNSNENENQYYHYPLLYEYDINIKTIILLYENESHFKLIGKFQGQNMTTFFDVKTTPKEILKLIGYLR
jgi:hypothetical protein